MKRVISQAKSLGAKSVVVIGGGEPTVYPQFKDLIKYINQRQMIPVVITNGQILDVALCRFLYDENASVLLKFDSFDARIQDRLTGIKGSSGRIAQALNNLLRAGFRKSRSAKHLRCGISFVVTKLNHTEIPRIWKFCRDNGIYPNLEQLIPANRGLRNSRILTLPKESVYKLKQRLLSIDRKYGYQWVVHAPLAGHGCLQVFYSMYITANGYVRPCADIDITYFNIKQMTLLQIFKSPFFRKTRMIEKYLKGKCFGCEHGKICIGCRGHAFCVGTQEGLDPFDSICREDPLCCKPPTRPA